MGHFASASSAWFQAELWILGNINFLVRFGLSFLPSSVDYRIQSPLGWVFRVLLTLLFQLSA